MKRHAKAVWNGTLKDGAGAIDLQSGALRAHPYSFASRFTDASGKAGTNPEELLAAAHAGCFAMQLSHLVGESGHRAESLDVKALVNVEPDDGGFAITTSELTLDAKVPGMAEDMFVELAHQAKAGCPVSRALGNVAISLKIRFSGA